MKIKINRSKIEQTKKRNDKLKNKFRYQQQQKDKKETYKKEL